MDSAHFHTIPHYTAQFRTIPCNSRAHNTAQFHTIPYNTVQYRTIPHYTLQFARAQFRTIRHNGIPIGNPTSTVPTPPRRSAVLWTGLGPGLGVVDCVVVVVGDVVGRTGDSSEQKLMEGWTGPLTAFSLFSKPKQELETETKNRK